MYKYERIAIIGSGSYGQVAKAKHRKSGQIVAIKRFIETEQDMNIRRMALREINLLKVHSTGICDYQVFLYHFLPFM